MSKSVVTYPIVGAVRKLEEFGGSNKDWITINPTQEELKKFLGECREEIPDIPEIESIASNTAAIINAFLKERGFDICIPELAKWEFAAASVLDIIVKWLETGKITSIVTSIPGKTYPAIELSDRYISFFKCESHTDPVIRIDTRSGDSVYLTLFDGNQDGVFSLIDKAQELEKGEIATLYSGLVMPMVDMNQLVDISWICGMMSTNNNGDPLIITQAYQQTKFRMNEIGARAQSAVALVCASGCGVYGTIQPVYIVDKPFFLWIKRPGLCRPLFVAHITEEDWKIPKKGLEET